MIYYNDTVAERLRRWTANPFPIGIASSNLVGVVFFWGCRSIGRSLALHARGTGIETQHLHIYLSPASLVGRAPH